MYYILQNASILVNTIGGTQLSALLKPETTLLPVLEFVYEEEYNNILEYPGEKAKVQWTLSANVYLIKQTTSVSSVIESAMKKGDKPIVLDTSFGEGLIGPISTFRDLLTSASLEPEISIFDSKGYAASVSRKKEEIREKFDTRAREWVLRWYELHDEITKEEIESEQRKLSITQDVPVDEDADLEPANELIAEAKVNESVTTLNELYEEREKLKEKIVKLYEGIGETLTEATPLITWTAVVEGIKKKANLAQAGIVNELISKYGENAFYFIHESVMDGLTDFLFYVGKPESEKSKSEPVSENDYS